MTMMWRTKYTIFHLIQLLCDRSSWQIKKNCVLFLYFFNWHKFTHTHDETTHTHMHKQTNKLEPLFVYMWGATTRKSFNVCRLCCLSKNWIVWLMLCGYLLSAEFNCASRLKASLWRRYILCSRSRWLCVSVARTWWPLPLSRDRLFSHRAQGS